MKKKQFYSHLVTLEHIKIELSTLVMRDDEKKDLLTIAEKQLHHAMLDAALSQIKSEEKKTFLHHVAHDEHTKAWEVLRMQAKDAEKHLLHAAHELYEELRQDIKELREQAKQEERS